MRLSTGLHFLRIVTQVPAAHRLQDMWAHGARSGIRPVDTVGEVPLPRLPARVLQGLILRMGIG